MEFIEVPAHFYGAVGALQLTEGLAARAWQELADAEAGTAKSAQMPSYHKS